MLPQHFDSTDLLFVEPDDVLKDTVDTFIFKPDAPCTATPEVDPEFHVASPTPALASAISHSTSLNNLSSGSEGSSNK